MARDAVSRISSTSSNHVRSDTDHWSSGRVGMVAGWGSFPIEVARKCVEEGRELYIAALKGHADPRLVELATHLEWFGVLKIGGQMRYFRRHGISEVALAGKIFKGRILYEGRGWLDHLPDLTCARILGGSFVTKSRDARDDTLLSALVAAYHRQRIKIMPITHIAPQLLVEEGNLTARAPNRSQRLDIDFAWEIARQMGALDIGQSLTVKDQVVLGVEAIEGTDALIARTEAICPRGGFTLVKVAKPQQDMRFDVPTIGLRTVQQLVVAGGRALAVEAGRTILVEREKTIDFANRHGLAIVSIAAQETSHAASSSDNSTSSDGSISASNCASIGNRATRRGQRRRAA